MSSEQTVQPRGYNENPDLLPIPESERKLKTSSFIFMMFSMNTCIPMFFFGPIGVGLGLSIWQAVVAAFLGNLAAVVVMALNGHAGTKYGITFPVQLRSSYGFRGTHLPVILRGIAGTVWFGIEAWNGALALTMIVLFAAGVPAEQVTPLALQWLVIALLFYLGSFVIVMRRGVVKGIGRMADFAGPIMLLYFVWLAWWLATNPQFAARIPGVYVSKVGWLSIPFFIYLAIQTNWWATVALNISDLTRGVRKWSTVWLGTIIGVTIAQAAVAALSYYLVVMAQEVLPQAIVVKYAPGAVAIVLGLLFTFLAPWSTDITANAPPLIDILMSTFRMKWKPAVLTAAIIAFFAAPWWAVQSGPGIVNYVQNWALNYGILLGPFVGPMIGHYWIVAKTNIDLQKLYTKGPEGYWYKNGVGLAAITSWILTIITSYGVAYLAPDYLLSYFEGIPFPGGIIWYYTVVASLIFYLIFAKIFKEWE